MNLRATMWWKIFISAAVGVVFLFGVEGQSSGYRLAQEPTYFITGPNKVYPNQVVQLSVSIVKLYYEQINVRAIIKKNNKEEIASEKQTFDRPGTTFFQMRIPDNANEGNYTLRVEGTVSGGVSGFIFVNETKLMFARKQISVLIQTNKPIYRQGQKVMFRVMPVQRNLMSQSGSMDIYALDATGTVVRRWLSMQTNAGGVLEMNLQLTDQPAYGTWKIRVNTFGYWYEKQFEVIEFWVTAIDVNVSMPIYMMENDFGVAGVIMANLSLGQPAKGTIKVKMEIRPPEKHIDTRIQNTWPTIERETRYFPGVTDFFFTMDEIRNALGGKSPAGKELYVEAVVDEWFLVQKASGSAICVIYGDVVDLVLMGDTARTFKPNMPVSIYFAVKHPDDMPLSRPFRRQVTVQRSTKMRFGQTVTNLDKLLVGDDGIAHYRFIPEMDAQFITVKGYYDLVQSRFQELTLYRHYSPTDRYIFVETSTPTPMVDEYMIFTIKTSNYTKQVFYQILAAGNIITGGQLEMASTQRTFSVAVSRDMIPEARIVAYYIYQGEVIADSLNFFVNGTRINKVDIKFNRGKDFSGNTIEISGRTDPGSYIGFHAIDYELWAYGGNPFITETEIIEELETYDDHANTSFKHKWRFPEEQTQLVHFPSYTYGVDANTTFTFAGLLVFTDANVTRIPHYCNETMGEFPCMDGMCYKITEWCNGARFCADGADEMGCKFPVESPYTPPFRRISYLTRHFMETGEWAWTGYFVKPDGQVDLKIQVPDEPMSWVVGAFSISRDLGFGVTHEPARHQATRSFYMRAEMPETCRRGEQIGVRLGLFNYWDQDLEVIVTLHESDDYRFVIVEDFGIVNSYDPRTIKGNIQTMVFLPMMGVVEIHLPVLPIKDGCMDIKVDAYTSIMGDTETLTTCVTYDGVTNYLHTPMLIDLINSGSSVLPDLEIPVPERFVKPNEREHLFVPGSARAYVGIVGDVVGPGFVTPFLDAENTLRKPFGCGEQQMYNFASNMFYLKYLKATDQLEQELLDSSLEHLNIALQRLLSYKSMTDGSFSVFRDYPVWTPSVWMTSFVLHILHTANEKDWEQNFYIPIDLLNEMVLWMCQQQNQTSGAFIQTGPVYDRKLRSEPFELDGETMHWNVSLTAHVLISLSEADRITGEAEHCKNTAKMKATQFLERIVPHLTDPFQTAIVAYALELTGSVKNAEAFQKLQAIKRVVGEHLYWADKEVPQNDVKVIDNIINYLPRKLYDNEGYAVAASSYAMLTYMRKNMVDASEPIMKWLQSMRNSFAGQASTQDSIVALEAITTLASKNTDRSVYNIEVTVEATVSNYTRKVRLDKTNWQKMQIVEVPRDKVWGSIRGVAKGSGMALMQLATEVNVEWPHLIEPQPATGRYFDVRVEEAVFQGKNYSIYNLTVCSRWLRPDISERTGMAVLEMETPTGYVITNDVLRGYAQSGQVPTLHRAEAYSNKVVFYFDYLEHRAKTCVNFRLDRWFPVANMTIQHKLKVYDYYEPGMHNTTIYTTRHLFHLHICQACGSFQCPYCPFYNLASKLHISYVGLFISVLVSVSLSWVNKRLLVT